MKKEMLIPKWYKTSSYHFHLKGNFAMHTHTPLPSIIVVGYSTDISFLRLLLEYHNDSLMLYFTIKSLLNLMNKALRCVKDNQNTSNQQIFIVVSPIFYKDCASFH